MDWHDALARIERGTLLVVGDDAGRSRFARFVVGQLDRSLPRVALVDGDPRHPKIGVPTCLGLALTGPWEAPAALWFVGDGDVTETAPARLAGAVELVRRARDEGAEAVVVDGGPWNPGAQPGYPRALATAVDADQILLVGDDSPALGHLADALDAPGRTVQRVDPRPTRSTAGIGIEGNGNAAADRGTEARFEAHFRNAARKLLPRNRLVDASGAPPERPPQPGAVVGLLADDDTCLALGWVEAVRPDHVALWTPHPDIRRVRRIRTGGPVVDTGTWGTPLGDTPHRLPERPVAVDPAEPVA